jgi:hypothetical protein
VAEAGVRNWGARGGPFIGVRGGEGARGGVHRRAHHGGMVAHSGDDEMAWAGGVMGWLGWRKGTEAQGANRAGERVMARRRGSGDRVASPGHGSEEGADGRGPLAKERDREGGECGLTGGAEPIAGEQRERERGAADGWGRNVSGGRGHAAMGRLGHGREGSARVREREEAWTRSGPTEGAGFPFPLFFYFLFLFSISISISFISFSFEQIIS